MKFVEGCPQQDIQPGKLCAPHARATDATLLITNGGLHAIDVRFNTDTALASGVFCGRAAPRPSRERSRNATTGTRGRQAGFTNVKLPHQGKQHKAMAEAEQ